MGLIHYSRAWPPGIWYKGIELQQCLFVLVIGIPEPRELHVDECSVPKPAPGKKYTAFPLTCQEIPLKVT